MPGPGLLPGESAPMRARSFRAIIGRVRRQARELVTAFKRKIHLPGGKVLMREFKAGDVMYSPDQAHIGENVGTTPTHVIMVELKSVVKP